MKRYRDAAAKLQHWLDTHFDAEGRCVLGSDDVRFYSKAPYLLTMAGLRAKGARVAKRVYERFLDERGDLTGPPTLSVDQRVYGMGWLALGATVVERFDLADRIAGRLAERQDAQCGGIVLPDADAEEEVAEACFSGGAGMGLAAAGKHQAAQLMAERFVALLDDQPETGRFYNRFRRDGSVVAKPAAGAWEKMYDLELPEQRPANFATVALTLVWAGRAMGEERYFAAAGRYADLVYSHRLDPAEFGRATKFGWAMIQLYDDTGDSRLLERAQRLGDVLVREQSDDGLWDPRPLGQGTAPPWERLSYSSDCAMTVCALAGLPQA
ncbi:MAG: hypothetical protein CL878_00435 [Dehalococcoidia bacterium]|nr:hypothetical protein [Dehalococcoidia bacterium]